MEQEGSELDEKIDKLTEMVKENQRMIHSLYKRARISAALVFLKWFLIIGITLGAFYFMQPVIDALMSIYGGFTGTSTNSNDMVELFKSFR